MIEIQQSESENELQNLTEKKSMLRYSQVLEKLYTEDITAKQLIQENYLDHLQIHNVEIYVVLKQKLLQIVNIHRRFVNASFDYIFRNGEITDIKIQTSILILCDHYETLMNDNSQSIILWKQFCKSGLKVTKQALNQWCIKYILPFCTEISFQKLYEYMPKMFNGREGERVLNFYNLLTKNNYIKQKLSGDMKQFSTKLKKASSCQQSPILLEYANEEKVVNVNDKNQLNHGIDNGFDINIQSSLTSMDQNKKKNKKKKKKQPESQINIISNVNSLIKTRKNDVKWSKQQEDLLNLMNNFQISQSQRIQCNVSESYVNHLDEWLNQYQAKGKQKKNKKNKNKNKNK